MADYDLDPRLIDPLIDAIAFSADPRLDSIMEMLSEIRREVETGRAVIIAVKAADEAIR